MTSKDLQMENASICFQGRAENEERLICDVGILRDFPRISQLFSHTLNEDIVADFDIPNPILPDRNSCDLLLGTNYQDLITRMSGPRSFIKQSKWQASDALVGWVISGWHDKPNCELNKKT